MTNYTSKTILANNTGADLRTFDAHFIAYVRDGKALPAELADLFTVTIVEAEDGIRGVIDWA